MFRTRIAGAAVLVGVLALGTAAAFTDTVIVSALWIGNSFTAKYVLPNSLKTMFRGARDNTYILMNNTEKIEWGENLKYHYESTDAYQALMDGDFDYVILQDFPYSSSASEQQNLIQYGGLFVDGALRKGTIPVIFWTWPPESNRSQLGAFVQMYESFCAARDVMIAPVNAAWRHVFGQHPDYPLYNEDELHQSPYGHYLNLCVFYSVFKRSSSEGITYRNWGEYPSAPLTQIAVDTAAYLQAQAWAVVDSMLGPFTTAVARRNQPLQVVQPGMASAVPSVVMGGCGVPQTAAGAVMQLLPNGAVRSGEGVRGAPGLVVSVPGVR
jgi:hypothetical protein